MKRGFTLIELLAVITILVIITLIAVPIVISVVNSIEESSILRSSKHYLTAVEYSVTNRALNKKIPDGIYNIISDGNVCIEYKNDKCIDELVVKVKGDAPKSGSISVENGKIKNISVKYNDKTIVKNSAGQLMYKEPVCEVTSGDGTKVGDEITCGTESFYIVKIWNEEIKILAKHNLNVGDNKYNNKATFGIQDENIGKGNNTNGYVSLGNSYLCRYETSNELSVYDATNIQLKESDIFQHLNNYSKYLNENLGVFGATVTMMNYELFEFLGCSIEEYEEQYYGYKVLENPTCINSKYSWLYSTNYWTDFCRNRSICYPWDNVCNPPTYVGSTFALQTTGNFSENQNNTTNGLRPVVIISKEMIKPQK